MKWKKLTLNSLVFGNLKNRKKQYVIMVIGIVLAMVFSSSVIIAMFSLDESRYEIGRKGIGVQDEILLNVAENSMQQAQKDGYVKEFGYAHMLGYAAADSSNEEENGFYIAWLDDTAKKLSYQSFIEGAYPTNENEIAVEKSALARLGIDAKIGDEINLCVFVQNGIMHTDQFNQKTYKLVGIADDKASNIDRIRKTNTHNEQRIPAAFVCDETQIDAGGKESLAAYLTLSDFEYPEYITIEQITVPNNRDTEFQQNYLAKNYNLSNEEFYAIETDYKHYDYSYAGLQNGIAYMCIIGVVLTLTSCIAIVNSLNSNIKERKQQIGMLRAVGSTKRQITNILGKETMLLTLFSVPASLVISCLLLLVVSNIFISDFVLKIDVVSVVVCAIVGFITVMLASLIPIFYATRITPMQAIRNIDTIRKMKVKKIKSQKEFSVSQLLAQRNMAFHKGTKITVSVILAATILLSSVGFSLYFKSQSKAFEYGYDYGIDTTTFLSENSMYNSTDEKVGISDTDKQALSSLPYVSNAYGIKRCSVNLMIDEYTDFFKIFTNAYGDWAGAEGVTADNYKKMCKSQFTDYYLDWKNAFGYEKDVLSTTLYAVDDWKLESFKNNIVSGKINLDKLASGEEIILISPQKAAVGLEISDNRAFDIPVLDDKVNTDKFNYALYGECEYKPGDTINLSTVLFSADSEEYKRTDKKVTIGAIISPVYFQNSAADRYIIDSDFGVLTSIAGINQFSQNEKYQNIYLNTDGNITEEINADISTAVKSILYKYDFAYFTNAYEDLGNKKSADDAMLVVMIAIIIIGFAVCAGLANNTFSASICERKRELGTLRAVGLSKKEFLYSYIIQLLKTFALGIGVGFGVFTAGYLICKVIVQFKNQGFQHYMEPSELWISFNPWITIAFCIILFAVCSINLWLKISKEMKNSIIDNIREL